MTSEEMEQVIQAMAREFPIMRQMVSDLSRRVEELEADRNARPAWVIDEGK